MQIKNKILEDISQMATGAFGSLSDSKKALDEHINGIINARIEEVLTTHTPQGTQEFDAQEIEVIKAMATKARTENQALQQEIETLKQELQALRSTIEKS